MSEASGPRFRSVLDRFAAYKPGRTVVAPDGRSFKLSSNESPYGPLPSVLTAIGEAAGRVNRYPDNNATALIEAISARFGVPAEHVAVGCGSVGVTQMLLEAVGEPDAEVLYAWRSFEAYPLLVALSGAVQVQVPLRDEAHDLTAMADAITERTRLVFVCNPNNPTGTVVRRAALEAFLDRVPADCLVILDEAYREYVRDDEVPDGLSVYADRPNVAVLRTFSKAYGLAGLRTGFMVAHPQVAEAVRKTMLPFTVNAVAQAAAIASLSAEGELLERVESTVKERERVVHTLRAQGWTVPPTEANFVWLRLGERTVDFSEACNAHGVSVRPFPGEGVRVSIGAPEENDAFLTVAAAFPHRG
ncbi:histidinol-phosphate transaminase [Thermomonospora umbrina]|uniref:Aromatic amino acid aminotransferase n=1 Tax=Thermomonospora umbrina TaxID=111806 RepID=A0A3D9SU18_9ACTN|nr:histidinol-phosphate transaminase [Thermomonospora umbrina]REE97513.1 histidinol-phosphate aminotransferase [Thermomonospora umbrina]